MPRFALDLKMAIRAVLRARFVSALAILAFALGIGVTTAVFTIFNAVLLRPLPYPDSDRLVAVYGTQPTCPTCPASFPKYHDWKTRNRVFSAMGGSTPGSFVMTGHGDPTRVSAMSTTASLGSVFRVPPALGRWYTEQEDNDSPDKPRDGREVLAGQGPDRQAVRARPGHQWVVPGGRRGGRRPFLRPGLGPAPRVLPDYRAVPV